MSDKRSVQLPMVATSWVETHPAQPTMATDAELDSMIGVVPADPSRIEDGWEHRFVAVGARAREMIELYQQLGFEVAADPVPDVLLPGGCAECFGGTTESYLSIYTRKPATD